MTYLMQFSDEPLFWWKERLSCTGMIVPTWVGADFLEERFTLKVGASGLPRSLAQKASVIVPKPGAGYRRPARGSVSRVHPPQQRDTPRYLATAWDGPSRPSAGLAVLSF